jgi:uncharacterized membrane protein YuzA (DUF378 family)
MIIYIIITIGALWGIATFFSLREENKEIQEMIESAREATRHSHGSE